MRGTLASCAGSRAREQVTDTPRGHSRRRSRPRVRDMRADCGAAAKKMWPKSGGAASGGPSISVAHGFHDSQSLLPSASSRGSRCHADVRHSAVGSHTYRHAFSSNAQHRRRQSFACIWRVPAAFSSNCFPTSRDSARSHVELVVFLRKSMKLKPPATRECRGATKTQRTSTWLLEP